MFDSPIYGPFIPGFRKFRKEAGIMTGLLGRKRSPDLAFSFAPRKDPEVVGSCAVVFQYAKEVWNAALPRAFRLPSGLSLGTLALGINSHLQLHSAPPKQVTGPISALRKSLFRNGWSFDTPFILRDKYNQTFHLPSISPKRVKDAFARQLREAIAQRSVIKLFRQADDSVDAEAPQLFECGAFLQPLYALFDTLPPKEAYTLLRICTNGIFTNNDLLLCGYDIDPVCKNCGDAADTIYHRCYTCPCIATRAEAALGPELFNSILEAGPGSIMATRCLRPAFVRQTTPSPTTVCGLINFSDGDSFNVEDGEVFGDGSCFNSSYPELARAGFAIVQLDNNDQVLKAIFGCLPANMPQTSLAAECAAFFSFISHAPRGTYVGDCEEVLSRFRSPLADAMSADNVHACTWKACMLKGGHDFQGGRGVVKVKAHQCADTFEGSPAELRRIKGNDAADRLAKQGALLHPPNSDDIKAFKGIYRDIRCQALHMVDCLKNLSMSRSETQGRLVRLPDDTSLHMLPLSLGSKPGKRVHSFRWQNKCWVCDVCLFRTVSLASARAGSVACPGPPPFHLLLKQDSNGHVLWSAGIKGGGVILFCSLCFHYASPHPRLLAKPCLGRPCSEQSSEMFYLRRRRHPVLRSKLLLPARFEP